MHDLEPYYSWRELYNSEKDPLSPFYQSFHSEFEFSKTVYNYYIHPQWDNFGSTTLYVKIIYTDYKTRFTILEFIGEWNDAINNDIMFLKRNVIEILAQEKIKYFILIGENILNFHSSDDCYYEEWFDEIEDGWIAAINFRNVVLTEWKTLNIDLYINFGGELDSMNWRINNPLVLFKKINKIISYRLS